MVRVVGEGEELGVRGWGEGLRGRWWERVRW